VCNIKTFLCKCQILAFLKKEIIKNTMEYVYFILAYFFFLLGDICSKIPTQTFFILYQRFMNISLTLDSKSGYKIWKLPKKKHCKKAKKVQ
jgi:hypothetical protein